MIVAAHQPNFLPWLGFFDRVRRAQRFVLLDHVQFERQNYQNRTLIKTQGGPKWLTVPVVQKSRDELILDKEICNDKDGKEYWGRKAYLTLETCYSRAPHFKDYSPKLKQMLIEARWNKLIELNISLLRFCLDALEIHTPLVRSSELQVSGQKSELVLSMVRAAGGKTYIAGMGGSKGYLDLDAFKAAGVEVAWQTYGHPEYPQVPTGTPFVKGLSVLDLLFNCGPQSRAVLEKGCPDSLGEGASHGQRVPDGA